MVRWKRAAGTGVMLRGGGEVSMRCEGESVIGLEEYDMYVVERLSGDDGCGPIRSLVGTFGGPPATLKSASCQPRFWIFGILTGSQLKIFLAT